MRSYVKNHLPVIFCLLFATFTFCANTCTKHFKIEERCRPSKNINALFKNNQGYIYAGTSKGLYKFDGLILRRFLFKILFPQPAITAIFQDNENQLWVGLQSGDIARLVNGII